MVIFHLTVFYILLQNVNACFPSGICGANPMCGNGILPPPPPPTIAFQPPCQRMGCGGIPGSACGPFGCYRVRAAHAAHASTIYKPIWKRHRHQLPNFVDRLNLKLRSNTIFEDPNRAFLNCCMDRKLPDGCLQKCNYANYRKEMIIGMYLKQDSCPLEAVREIQFCAAQGQDHRACCHRQGVANTLAGPKCFCFLRSTTKSSHSIGSDERRLTIAIETINGQTVRGTIYPQARRGTYLVGDWMVAFAKMRSFDGVLNLLTFATRPADLMDVHLLKAQARCAEFYYKDDAPEKSLNGVVSEYVGTVLTNEPLEGQTKTAVKNMQQLNGVLPLNVSSSFPARSQPNVIEVVEKSQFKSMNGTRAKILEFFQKHRSNLLMDGYHMDDIKRELGNPTNFDNEIIFLLNEEFCSTLTIPVREIQFCAAQGQDHRACCHRQGVANTLAGPKCLVFCDQRPNQVTQLDLTYLPCFERFNEMKTCFWNSFNFYKSRRP
ncbi:Protein of unknown function DB domain containing protein [Aphelenchoides besseyi]|nr:Protein of unknown function DB domain containing protein [Aphelenchoides besseyi]